MAQGLAGIWPTFAGDAVRSGVARGGAVSWGQPGGSLGSPLWTASTDQLGRAITFVGQAGIVADHARVYAIGSVAGSPSRQYLLLAFRRQPGACQWSCPIPTPQLESFATPTLVPELGVCLAASGSAIVAIDCRTGVERFRATLDQPIVNASPAVDASRWGRCRAFITDYDGTGIGGKLYCINLSPRLAPLNPFNPGEVVWSTPIGGTSGNSPSVASGRVYVATVGEAGFSPGRILCFDANATTEPAPLWSFDNIINEGFYGGVTVASGSIYAASYGFFGGLTTGNLVKLDAVTGSLHWSVPCNRTASTPILLPPATGRSFPRLALSGGLQGFGTVPTIEVFEDRASTAVQTWNSATASFTDTNGNGRMDTGEFTAVGGWSHTPLLVRDAGGVTGLVRLLVGSPAATGSTSSAGSALRFLDLTNPAGSFLTAITNAGSTPAVAGSSIYSLGSSGLVAFGPTPPRTDVNDDGLIDEEDLFAWDAGQGFRDADGNGVTDAADRLLVLRDARRDE